MNKKNITKELPFIVDLQKGNVYSRMGSSIKYIVVHDTENTDFGANAKSHKNYNSTNSRGASAHIFVDDHSIYQYVGDSKSAGSVGDGNGKYGITNRNSISIEMCINSDGDYERTFNNTVELVKNMMIAHKISAENVIRHYDASRKSCPGQMKTNNWALWWEFKERIKEPRVLKMDLSKSSKSQYLGNEKESEQVEEQKYIRLFIHGVEAKSVTVKDGKSYLWIESIGKLVPLIEFFEILGLKVEEKPYKNGTAIFVENWITEPEKVKSKYYIENGLQIIETTSDNIEIALLNNTLSGSNGINGTFFWQGNTIGIAINNSKKLQPNSHVAYDMKNTPRGTIYYKNNKIYIERIWDIRPYNPTWAISGLMLYPSYIPSIEGFVGKYADVLRATKHTALGFKDNKIYLIASDESLTMQEFRNKILNSKLAFDGLVALDGGGSTQLSYAGKDMVKSSRKIVTAILCKEL